MVEDDRGVFIILIESVCAAFNAEPTEALLEGYWIALADLPYDSVRFGMGNALRECRFMPKPAEIRELSGEVKDSTKATTEWTRVIALIGSMGSYRSPEFNLLTERAVNACGGWKRLCSLDSDELHSWTRKRFEEMYCVYAESERREPSRLIGDGGGAANQIIEGLAEKMALKQ